MNKAINHSGNFTINYPTKEFTKTPNYLITNKTLKPFETLVLQFILSLHPNTKLTQHLCSEAFDVSLRHIERVFKVFHDKGLVTSYKKKNDNNLYDTFYDFHTDILDGTREDLPDELVGIVPDTDVGTRENIKESLESNNDNGLSTVNENSSIPTQMSGHINTNLNNKTIYNTKEKINNKKEGEDKMDSYESTVKLMRDKLVYSGKVENLIKEHGIEQVNKHLRYLDYFELDKKHVNYNKNLTFAFLESLRNNNEPPNAYRAAKEKAIFNKRYEAIKQYNEVLKINTLDRVNTFYYPLKKIMDMKDKFKLNLDEFTLNAIETLNRRRKLSGQGILSLEEKTTLINDSTDEYYKTRNEIILTCKTLKELDIKPFFSLIKITISNNQTILQTLNWSKFTVDKEINKLETFILLTAENEIWECA